MSLEVSSMVDVGAELVSEEDPKATKLFAIVFSFLTKWVTKICIFFQELKGFQPMVLNLPWNREYLVVKSMYNISIITFNPELVLVELYCFLNCKNKVKSYASNAKLSSAGKTKQPLSSTKNTTQLEAPKAPL